MKTIIAHILISLAILSFSANAYADGNEKNEKAEAAKEVMVYSAESLDAELKIEAWMTNVFSFRSEKNLDSELFLEDWMMTGFEAGFSEEELALEEWMVSPFASAEEIEEESLELENWMLKF